MFKVGDRVVRTGVTKDGVVQGEKYTVTSIGDNYMSLEQVTPYPSDTDSHYWACDKFKKATKWWKDV